MKTLTLLRHAKSGWDEGVARDFDRPLNAKGRKAANAMGRHLKGLDARFDHVVASPAQRVVQTVADLAGGFGARIEPAWDKRLYLASAATLLDVVRETPGDAETLLMIGHNPGLEDFVLMLMEGGEPSLIKAAEEKYPTATVAELTFAVDDWADVAPETGTLTRFIRPRDIDAALGPDED